MKYKVTTLTNSPKSIVANIIEAENSQLLIPPQYSNDQIEVEELSSDQKSIGLFSSGTTSDPKCIWNTFENLLLNAQRSAEVFEISSNHRLLILAKPCHVAGLSWAMMAEELGCEYEFITTNRGEEKKWFKAITEFKPDCIFTVPPVLRAIANESWFVPNVVFGGIPFQSDDFEPLSTHCSTMYQGYGQTEAGGLIACHKHNASGPVNKDEHLNCGIPVKGVELKVEGTVSKSGEIYIKSETAHISEWYNSGDLGFIRNNEIFLTGRAQKPITKKY